VRVLSEIDADIVALQEVVCVEGKAREDHQARYIAEKLGYHMKLGENRQHKGGAYGNVLLSRFPSTMRGTMTFPYVVASAAAVSGRTSVWRMAAGCTSFNLHLGTSFFERREQAASSFGNRS